MLVSSKLDGIRDMNHEADVELACVTCCRVVIVLLSATRLGLYSTVPHDGSYRVR